MAPADNITTESGQPTTTESGIPIATEGVTLVMSPFPATMAPGSNLRLVVTPEDATGKPAKAPGPIMWAFLDDASKAYGTITPSTDGTSCLFASNGKVGLPKVTAGIPTVPAVLPVEFDITVDLPLATQLVPSVQPA